MAVRSWFLYGWLDVIGLGMSGQVKSTLSCGEKYLRNMLPEFFQTADYGESKAEYS